MKEDNRKIKRTMQSKNIYIALMLFAALSVKAQDTLKLDLETCRNMAIENSKEIKIAEENLLKAQGGKMAARSAWLPNISASATGIYSNQEFSQELYLPTQTFDMATGELRPNIAMNPMTGEPIIGPDGNPVFNMYGYLPFDITLQGGVLAGVSAEQPLYAGGKIIAGNKMANIGEMMAENNKQLKHTEIIYQTDQVFFQYLSVKEKVKLARQYQKLLQEVVAVVNDSYETGMINKNELLKVQVKFNEASLQVQKAQTGQELLRMSLCRAIGVPMDTPVDINDSIGSFSFEINNIENAPASGRIEYQLLEGQVKMAEQNLKMVKGDYRPTAGVSLGYNYFLLGLDGMDNFDNTGVSAIGSIKIPITTFGERKGKVSAARADYNIHRLKMEQTKEYLQLEIEQARLNLMDAYTRVEMAQTALEQADENMRISDDSYSLGMETIVNLLGAQAEWQRAYSNKIDAITDFKIKESNYLRVSNSLIK